MRRAFALILLALISFPLLSPALLAFDRDSSLPACCRRDGTHHCAMLDMQADDSAPALQTGRCPLFPNSSPFPSEVPASPAAASPAGDITVIERQAEFARSEAPRPVRPNRADQKRGPPSLPA